MGKPIQRRRPSRAKEDLALRPEDFDGTRYSAEVIRVADSKREMAIAAEYDRVDLIESAFLIVVGLCIIGGAVALGIATDVSSLVGHATWYLLPMIVLPIGWFTILHLIEKIALTPHHRSNVASSLVRSGSNKIAIY